MHAGKVKMWQISSIYRAIYKTPGITRLELVDLLKVDKSMVTRLLTHLIENGWVRESGERAKKVPLYVNPGKILIAGVDLQPEIQNVCVCDMDGKILTSRSWVKYISDMTPFLNETLPAYLKSTGLDIGAIGLAIPGVYEKSSNRLISSQPFGVTEPVALPDQIPGFNCPIFVDNDARCCGWGIVAFNREEDDFLLLLVGFDEFEEPTDQYKRIAIGTALFLDQKARDGQHSKAGEFRSIYRNSEKIGGQSQIEHADRQKIKTDKAIFNQFIQELAAHAGFLVNYLDLKKLYIGGTIENYRNEIEPVFLDAIETNRLYRQLPKAQIQYAGLGDLSTARGAAGMVLENFFTEPSIELSTPFYKMVSQKPRSAS